MACQPHQREPLERLCRYITRPAICLERLSINSNSAGQVVYQLKDPFRDGTTHILLSPEEFIARLAALVPRPGFNLTRYQRSSSSITRLAAAGEAEYRQFHQRRLEQRDYVYIYIWADGIHFNVRLEEDRLCKLVVIAVAADGRKELLAIESFAGEFSPRHDKTVECLVKDREASLTYFDFPAEHWTHLRRPT